MLMHALCSVSPARVCAGGGEWDAGGSYSLVRCFISGQLDKRSPVERQRKRSSLRALSHGFRSCCTAEG